MHFLRISLPLLLLAGAIHVPVARSQLAREDVVVPMVKVYATVRGDGEAPLMDLKKEDFTVLEDGKRQEIAYFSQEALPLKIAVVLDCSGSMQDNLEAAKRAAISLLRRLAPADQALLISFGNSVGLATELTTDKASLEKKVEGLTAEGGTALYDALHLAILALRGQDGKRAIVLLSDGKDEAWGGGKPGSRRTFEEVSDELARSQITLYSICFGQHSFLVEWDVEKKWMLKEIFDNLSKRSGGRVILTEHASGLSDSFLAILGELRTQYNLFYTPSNTALDGRWRDITVVVDRPVREIVNRQGYFATR